MWWTWTVRYGRLARIRKTADSVSFGRQTRTRTTGRSQLDIVSDFVSMQLTRVSSGSCSLTSFSPPAESSKPETPQKPTPKVSPKKEEKKVVDAADFFGSKKVKQTAPPPRKERDPNSAPPADNVKVVTKDKKSKKKKDEEPAKKVEGDEFVGIGVWTASIECRWLT
jgi:hypothetical protein